MSTEQIEKVSIQGKGKLDGKKVNVSHSSSLMTNYESGHVASPGQKIASVADNNGNPMVFTVSENAGKSPSNLYLTYRDETEKTGWKQIDLTQTLPSNGGQTQCFAVTQFANGSITIALATSANGSGASTLHLANGLSDDLTSSDWTNLKSKWTERSCPISGLEITAMNMTNAPSLEKTDDGGPLLVVSGKLNGEINYYIVGTGTTPAATWPIVTPPDKAVSVDQILSGFTLNIGAGTFALYNNGQANEVGFQGLPNEEGVSQKYTLNLGAGVQSIAVSGHKEVAIPGMDTVVGNGLFVGGQNGITYFDPSSLKGNATGLQIISKDQIAGAKEIAVTESTSDNGIITVWAIDDNDNLVYTFGSKSDSTQKWSGPFIFKQNVAQIAPVKNHARETSEIMLVDLEGKMSYLWQDPQSTLWTESDIPLYTTSELIQYSCYTTEASFQTAAGDSVASTFRVYASTWSYAKINGIPHVLSPNNPATVKTENNGQLTIIMKVDSISTPNFTVTSDDLASHVQLNPSSSISNKLKNIKSGADLQNAKDQSTGQPIFTGTPQISYDDAAQAIQKLTALHNAPSHANGNVASASVVNHHKHFGNSINVSAHQGTWGLTMNADGTLSHQEGTHLEAIASGIFSDIAADAGDALRWLEHAAESVEHFVVQAVNDTVKFIIKVGKEVVHFIVDTAEQIYAAVSFILKKIGAIIEDIIKWIGFLFEWEDIIATKDALSAYTLKGFDFVSGKIKSAETSVENFFDHIKAELEKALVPQSAMPQGSLKSAAEKHQASNTSFKTPGGNFTPYHVKNSGMLHGQLTNQESIAQEIWDWVKNTVKTEIDSVETDLKNGVMEIINLYHSGDFTLENLFKIILNTLGDVVLDTLKTICVSALQLADIIVGIAKKVLTAKIEIPFLSSFYKLITGHDLTLLDGMSLLLAIPTTIIYKIAADKAPFSKDAGKTISQATAQEIFNPTTPSATPNVVSPNPNNGGTALAAAAAPVTVTNITEVHGAAKVYEDIGVIVAGICGVIDIICYSVDALSEDEAEDLPMIPKIQLGCSAVTWFMTIPVSSGPSQGVQFGQWGVQGLQLVADAIVIKVDPADKSTCKRVFAGVGIGTSVVDIILSTVSFGINAVSDESVSVTDGFGYGFGVVGNVGGIAQGIADWDPEPDTKAIAIAVGIVAGGAGSVGELGVGIAAATQS